MRGHFSIEWMAQSSRRRPANASVSAAAPGLAGTRAESLPGFYRRPDDGDAPEADKIASEVEEETSGYESERSLSPPSSSGRRPRTAFTAEQIGSLERAFERNAYLGTQDKAQLCRKLNLSDKQIRNWFQNRRMKLKRTVQDALAHACQAGAASRFAAYPEAQAYRPAPYPRYHAAPLRAAAAAAAAAALAPLPYVSPLDSLYQYGGVAGAVLPAAAPPPTVVGAYPAYPQYY